jgi:RNA polymerase-associated protein RTF1
VSIGKSEREYPFIFCSMTRASEREFAAYKAAVTNDGLTLPSKTELQKKLDDINNLVNRSFTEKELQEKLERSGVLKARAGANKRADLVKERTRAQAAGDEAKVTALDAQISALDPPKLAYGTTLETAADRDRANRGPTEQQRLAELNRRNRKENAERVRRAQVAEKKARMELARKVERGEASGDPFARVKVMPKIHYDASEPFAQRRAGTPLSNAGGSSRGGTPTPGREKSPLPQEGDRKKEKEKSPLPPSTHLAVPKPGGVDFAQFDPMAKMAGAAKGAAKKD